MKIISKYKDYYDFLSGIYGEDPKLILDRRDFGVNFLPTSCDFKVILYITGYVVEGVCKDGKFYYGEDLYKIQSNVPEYSNKYMRWNNEDNDDYISVEINNSLGKKELISVMVKQVKDKCNYNIYLECPILIQCNAIQSGSVSIPNRSIRFIKYPELNKLELGSYLLPEKIYQMILDWLSAQVDRKLNKVVELTNEQKIENKGFDKKTSFRPNMK